MELPTVGIEEEFLLVNARTGALRAAASHPTAPPDEVVYADERRYRRIAREFGPVADQTLVCGCHVHVSVPDRASGVIVLDRVRPWLSVLVALSANSPLWLGHDRGYDSWRNQVRSRWPTVEFASLTSASRSTAPCWSAPSPGPS